MVPTNRRRTCNEIRDDTYNYRVAIHSHAALHRNDICLERLVPIYLPRTTFLQGARLFRNSTLLGITVLSELHDRTRID